MKFTKILVRILLIGLCVVLLGGIVFFVGFFASGGDLSSLSNTVMIEQTYTENSTLHTLSVDFNNADVEVYFKEDATEVSVTYPKLETRNGKAKNEITIEESDGAVSIVEKQTWRSFISLWDFTGSKTVTVTLPSARAYTLDIQTDNGNVELYGDTCNLKSLTLNSDNGNIQTTNATVMRSEAMSLETDNGNIELGQFATGKLTVDTDNGNVKLQSGTVGGNALLTTDNGNVSVNGTLTAEKIEIDTDNGKIEASDGVLDAKNVILETDNGDITARLVGKKTDYNLTVEQDLGKSNVASEDNGADKTLTVDNNIGDIEIIFYGVVPPFAANTCREIYSRKKF